MSLQKILYDAIKDLQAGALDWIKHLSTDYEIKIKEYPAVILDNEPFEYNGTAQGITSKNDKCTLTLIVEYKNNEKLAEGDRIDAIEQIETDIKAIITELMKVRFSGASNLVYGRAEIYNTLIESKPVMVCIIEVNGVTTI